MTYTTKGLRLHNPFNIEKNPKYKWLGEVEGSLEPVFCQFSDDSFGLRAGFINLRNQLKEGFDTIEKLITKYAPPFKNGQVENNTGAYVAAVCRYTKLAQDTVLVSSNLRSLGEAIIIHEQGFMPYTDDVLANALHLAGVVENEAPITISTDNSNDTVIRRLCNLLSSILPFRG